MANSFRPAAEVTLYQAPDQNMISWEAEKPKTAIEMKGQGPGRRIAFRKSGGLERIDTFQVRSGGPEEGRDTGAVIIHVDDRSYEFTVPSSLFKNLHGTADSENQHWFPRGNGIFELLVRAAD